MDLYSRKIIGWSRGPSLQSQHVIDALKVVLESRRPGSGLMCHPDRGVQYACSDFQVLLKSYRIQCSMNRKGNCWDDSPMESFFATLKGDLVHYRHYQTRAETRQNIFEYKEVFYNRERIY
jgi:transposase InsO family protein